VLSDIEQQAISDPPTADLLAAATTATDAPATTPLPPANAVIVNADESSDVTGIQADVPAVAPGLGAAAPKAIAGKDAAAGSGEEGEAVDESAGESVDASAHSVGLGDVLGMPVTVRRIITAPSDAAAAVMNAGVDDADRNAPGKAQGMSVTPRSGDSRRSPRHSTDSSSSSAAAAAAPGSLLRALVVMLGCSR
jgi:hypothetical protein